jgi:O-antigen ligase
MYSKPRKNKAIEYLFYLIILLLPFDEVLAYDGVSIVKYVGILLFLFILSDIHVLLNRPKLFFLIAIPFIIGGLADLFNFNHNIGFNDIIRPFLILIFILLTYNLSINGKLNSIVQFIYYSTIIFLLYQLFFSYDFNEVNNEVLLDEDVRNTALGIDPNFAASYLILGVIISIYIILKTIPSNKILKYIAIVLVLPFLYAIIKTGSRGGLVALFFGILSIAFSSKKRKQVIYSLVFIFIFLGIGIIMVLNDKSIMMRILLSVNEGDSAGREWIWSEAWELSQKSPMLGFGFKGYMFELGFVTQNPTRATHNTFLAMLLSTGWIGLLLFVSFYLSVLKIVWKYRTIPYGNFLFSAFIISTISAQSINLEITKWFWIILALVISLKDNSWFLLDSKNKIYNLY